VQPNKKKAAILLAEIRRVDGGWKRKDRLKRVKSENRSDETTEKGKEKRGTRQRRDAF